jgi:hypothetical protein
MHNPSFGCMNRLQPMCVYSNRSTCLACRVKRDEFVSRFNMRLQQHVQFRHQIEHSRTIRNKTDLESLQ